MFSANLKQDELFLFLSLSFFRFNLKLGQERVDVWMLMVNVKL